MGTHLYKVGELYNQDRMTWPDGADYNFRGGAHELRVFAVKPTAAEIEAARTGRAQFYLYRQGDAIFFGYDLGESISGFCSFTIHLVPPDEQVVPDLPTADHAGHDLLSILLIDGQDGILKVIRACTFSPNFSRAMRTAIYNQSNMDFDADAHTRGVQAVMARYSDRELKRMAYAKTIGGE